MKTVGRIRGLESDFIVEALYRGFTRCMEAEARLNTCASDAQLELAREQLFRVKIELQQMLDDYVDSRIRHWLGATCTAGGEK